MRCNNASRLTFCSGIAVSIVVVHWLIFHPFFISNSVSNRRKSSYGKGKENETPEKSGYGKGKENESPEDVASASWFDTKAQEEAYRNSASMAPGYTAPNKETTGLQEKQVDGKQPLSESKDIKSILIWSATKKRPTLGQSLGRGGFLKSGCPVNTCTLVQDKSLLSQADAVLFNIRTADPMPPMRPSNQVYIYRTVEPPYGTSVKRPKFTGSFNITMTYRRDSDIVLQRNVTRLANKREPYQLTHPLGSRNRSVVWVVSNCNAPSERDKYVASLAKYIDVDIYGECGTLTCDKAESDYCFRKYFPSKYKFYLGFENSVCKQYVTEKLYRSLVLDMIPIVYGGTDYSSDAPPNSVINIMDYDSPKALAEHLKFLSENEQEYLKYFSWRQDYVISMDRTQTGYCKLCELLNDPGFHQTHSDVDSWFFDDMCDDHAMEKLREKAGDDW